MFVYYAWVAAMFAASALVAPAMAQTSDAPAAPAAATALPSGDSVLVRARHTEWSGPGVGSPARQEATLQVQLRKPLAIGYLSSTFGVRNDPINGTARAHRGLDIAAPFGTPIFASEDGTASFAGNAGDYGRMIQIDHRDGVQTRYGHLSRILIRSGARIRRGDTIGLVGSSGRSTGSHLHFEVRIDGRPVDPSRPLPGVAMDAPPPVSVVLPVTVHWRGWNIAPDRLPSTF